MRNWVPYETYTPSYSDPVYETYQSQDTAGEVIAQGYGEADLTGSVLDAFIDAAVNIVSAVVDAILPVQTASASSEVASAEFGGGEPPTSGIPVVDAFETYVEYKLAETVAPDEPLYDSLSAQQQGQVLGIQTLTDIVTNTPSVVANIVKENLDTVATAMDVISLTSTTLAAGSAMTGVGTGDVLPLLAVAGAAGTIGLLASGSSDVNKGNTIVNFSEGYFQIGTATLTDMAGDVFPNVPNSKTVQNVIENLPIYRGAAYMDGISIFTEQLKFPDALYVDLNLSGIVGVSVEIGEIREGNQNQYVKVSVCSISDYDNKCN
ncbi:MAG: hypothetical protein KIH69_019405 [Anaerolineae bacterium]|nr:hypothetical protein [Anaerolineae bacterium]